MKSLAKNKSPDASKKKEHRERRKTIVYRLMMAGATPREIHAHLNRASLADGKPNPEYMPCSTSVLEDDRRELFAEMRKKIQEERDYILDDTLVKLDDAYQKLIRASTKAEQQNRPVAQVQALNGAIASLMHKAKLAGVVVDKQQVDARVAAVEFHANVTAEDLDEVKRALAKTSISP